MSKHITTCPKFPSTLRFMSPVLTVKIDDFLKTNLRRNALNNTSKISEISAFTFQAQAYIYFYGAVHDDKNLYRIFHANMFNLR